ncbi:hypothetical protein JTE90_010613, partial [Oedothorax gibbosus]
IEVFTLETCCGMGTDRTKITLSPRFFKGPRGAPGHRRDRFLREQRPISGRPDSGDTNFKKKKKITFPGSPVDFPRVRLLYRIGPKRGPIPCPGFGEF